MLDSGGRKVDSCKINQLSSPPSQQSSSIAKLKKRPSAEKSEWGWKFWALLILTPPRHQGTSGWNKNGAEHQTCKHEMLRRGEKVESLTRETALGLFNCLFYEEKIHQPASASAAPDGKNQENLSQIYLGDLRQIYLGDLSQSKYNFSQTKSQPKQI